jgi:hypothetical protein
VRTFGVGSGIVEHARQAKRAVAASFYTCLLIEGAEYRLKFLS